MCCSRGCRLEGGETNAMLLRHSNFVCCVGAGMGNALPRVDLGTNKTAVSISAGDRHVCTILVSCGGQRREGDILLCI